MRREEKEAILRRSREELVAQIVSNEQLTVYERAELIDALYAKIKRGRGSSIKNIAFRAAIFASILTLSVYYFINRRVFEDFWYKYFK